MSAAGPPQGARPPGGEGRAAPIGGDHTNAAWCREDGDALILTLQVQPGARRTEVAGEHGDALKLRLAAPPVDGKANAELLRFLAEAFGVARRGAVLIHGPTSRHKVVRIDAPAKRPDRKWGQAL